MKTSINSPNIQIHRSLRQAAEQKLDVVLGRLSDRINHVSITVTDENALKGGVDKRCLTEVSLRGQGVITSEGRQEYVLASIDQALRRARSLILKRLKRRATRSRKPTDIAAETDRESRDITAN